MFNLIKRDVILQKRLLLTFIPFVAVFIVTDKHPAMIFLVASIFIPFNSFDYDKKAETNILLNSLPYTRTEIITSRYLGAVVYMILSIGVTSLTLWIIGKPFTITDIAIGSGFFLTFSALAFPFFYIFKSNLTFLMIIAFVVLVATGPSIVSFLGDHLTTITEFINSLSTPALYMGSALIILSIYVMSWGITTIIYQRKAF